MHGDLVKLPVIGFYLAADTARNWRDNGLTARFTILDFVGTYLYFAAVCAAVGTVAVLSDHLDRKTAMCNVAIIGLGIGALATVCIVALCNSMQTSNNAE